MGALLQSVSRVWKGGVLLLASALILVVGGCTGATAITPETDSGQYNVQVRLDPVTINPPQLGTLSFSVTNSQTNKPVTQFDSVSDALVHSIMVRKDLQYFRHDTAKLVVRDQVSAPAYFPSFGTYYVHSLYKPAGADLQLFRSTIVSGEAGAAANLEQQRLRDESRIPAGRPDRGLSVSKLTLGLNVAWIKGTEPVKAGAPTQLVFHLTEYGMPVTSLWPVFDAPGHLWLVDEKAENFAHLTAASSSRVLLPSPTPEPGQGSSPEPTPEASVPATSAPATPPTLVPSLRGALATITAIPYPTLLPVQQTPQGGLSGAQDVRPAVGYGPDLVFTHTFPHDGLYKMWLEVKWRDTVVTTDFVVRVEP